MNQSINPSLLIKQEYDPFLEVPPMCHLCLSRNTAQFVPVQKPCGLKIKMEVSNSTEPTVFSAPKTGCIWNI